MSYKFWTLIEVFLKKKKKLNPRLTTARNKLKIKNSDI